MGKVYDALRRAEEQRGRTVDEAAVPTPKMDWAPTPHGDVTPPRRSLWRRILARLTPHPLQSEATARNKRRIALLQPDSFVAEQFRSLRARIDSLSAQRPLRSLVVTSSVPGEGKTITAVNLGIVMSMSLERKVLLIDADLRKPKIHRTLGLDPLAGLAEVLMGEAELDKAIVRPEGLKLDVLAVRGLPPNPAELLGSARMRQLLEELAPRYDTVIIDTPPTLSLPDSKTLSEFCDGIVFVVRANETPQEEIQAALDVLDRRRVIGLVLNDAAVDEQRYRYA